jgi:hypothetical protein
LTRIQEANTKNLTPLPQLIEEVWFLCASPHLYCLFSASLLVFFPCVDCCLSCPLLSGSLQAKKLLAKFTAEYEKKLKEQNQQNQLQLQQQQQQQQQQHQALSTTTTTVHNSSSSSTTVR